MTSGRGIAVYWVRLKKTGVPSECLVMHSRRTSANQATNLCSPLVVKFESDSSWCFRSPGMFTVYGPRLGQPGYPYADTTPTRPLGRGVRFV